MFSTLISFEVSGLQKVFYTQFMRAELTYGVSSKYLIQEKLLLYSAVFIISDFYGLITVMLLYVNVKQYSSTQLQSTEQILLVFAKYKPFFWLWELKVFQCESSPK